MLVSDWLLALNSHYTTTRVESDALLQAGRTCRKRTETVMRAIAAVLPVNYTGIVTVRVLILLMRGCTRKREPKGAGSFSN